MAVKIELTTGQRIALFLLRLYLIAMVGLFIFSFFRGMI